MDEHGVAGKPFKQVAKKSTSLPPQNVSNRGILNPSIARHRSGSGGLSVVSDDDDEGVFSKSSMTDSNGHCGAATSKISVNHNSSKPTESSTNGVFAKNKDVSETKLSLPSTVSNQTVDEDSDGVVIINDVADCDNNHKSNVVNKVVVRTKRPLGSTGVRTDSIGHKKVCLDQKNGASNAFKKKIVINRKTISEWCLNFEKTCPNEEREVWKQKVKDLENTCEKWKKISLDLQRQLEEIRENKKIVCASSVVRSPSASTSQVVVPPSLPAVIIRTPQPIARSLSTSSVPYVPPMLQSVKTNTTLPPNMLPPASARLAMHASSSVSSLPLIALESSVVKREDTSKLSFIDLTDDDTQAQPKAGLPLSTNTRTPAMLSPGVASTRPATLVINAANLMARPTSVSYALTAAVRPTVIQARSQGPIPTMPVRAVRQYNPNPTQLISARHPAPLPPLPFQPRAPVTAKRVPTKPTLKLSRVTQGIVLSWNMSTTDDHEPAVQYQLFAYQQGPEIPTAALWKKVGTVEALPLPMACTLTQFQVGNRYHFAVRAVDHHGRIGAFSEPGSIHLEAISTAS